MSGTNFIVMVIMILILLFVLMNIGPLVAFLFFSLLSFSMTQGERPNGAVDGPFGGKRALRQLDAPDPELPDILLGPWLEARRLASRPA